MIVRADGGQCPPAADPRGLHSSAGRAAGHRRASRPLAIAAAAALVLLTSGALAAGSLAPGFPQPLPDAAFRAPLGPGPSVPPTLDAAQGAAGSLAPGAALAERPDAAPPFSRPLVPILAARPIARSLPAAAASSTARALHGWASWYDNGTTALRLPRGTRVRIRGPAGCITRRVTDYGPDAVLFPRRIADLTPWDFATVCGCSPARGTVAVGITIL